MWKAAVLGLGDMVVCRYNSHHRFPMTKDDLCAYVKSVQRDRGNLVFAIIFKENSNHIGNISLQGIDYINRTAEFAILLGEEQYWGCGIGKEAGRLVIEHGFKELNLNRINLGTTQENIGMQKVAEGLGFKKEGVRREMIFKNGKYNDVIEYGLLCSEWKTSRQ